MRNRLLILFLLAVAACAGCTTRYSITLRNGNSFTALGKPRLDRSGTRYVFKDASGRPAEVSRLSVREIAPESMRSPGASSFLPTAPK
jgi:hypothetical protein